MKIWSILVTVAVLLAPVVAKACTLPAGVEGQFLFNHDYNLVQYCDANNVWVRLGGSTTDARIGTLTANKWCAANAGGTAFDCTQNAPAAGITALTGDVTASGSGSVAATIAANAVTYAKIQNTSAASVLLGRGSASGAGAVQELTLGSGLSLSGTTLSATASGTVSGTTNYVAKFTGTSTIGNSQIFDNGTNVGIGTAAPATTAALDITSTSAGLLPPRMTTTQRNAIASPATGLMIYNTTNAQFEYYSGTVWSGIGSMTTGQIAAFALSSCPTGWSEYTSARGRFLRGIDPSGSTVDPSGTRAPGNQQADALQNITATWNEFYGGMGVGGASGAFATTGSTTGAVGTNASVTKATGMTFDASRVARTATETRPVNVAVIFCQYSGTGNVATASATVSGTANYVAKFTGSTVIGNSQIFDNGTNVGIGAAPGAGYRLDVQGGALHVQNTQADIWLEATGYPAWRMTNYQDKLYWWRTGSGDMMSLSNAGYLTTSGGGSWSDMRMKKDIHPLKDDYGLKSILALKPVTYHWKNKAMGEEMHIGFIAQDVEKVIPELVHIDKDKPDPRDINALTDKRTLDYSTLTVPLVKAVQELKADNDNLRQLIGSQGEEIKALKASIH